MENKLEQLLEKLLELGRKPNGKEYNHIHAEANRIMSDFGTFYRFCNYVEDGSINRCINLKLCEIVSINSGLWQFVCENGMAKKPDIDRGEVHNWDNPNHWLCESALKDESELEDFLLSNIVIKDE